MKLTSLALALASLSTAAFAQAPAPATPRLLCVYLDLRTLTASDLAAAQDQAIRFIQQQATPADQFAVMTYTSGLNVLQDFTANHDQLVSVLRAILPGEVTAAQDNSARLEAIQALAKVLGVIPQKKAVLDFSTPAKTSGDDAPELEATVRSLMDANVAIYPVDVHGFQFK